MNLNGVLVLSMESRKVQKLGTSSLVVTLPKDWVKRFKIRPGDRLYVVDEGNYLRIVPAERGSKAIPLVDVSRMPGEDVLSRIVHCLYVSGVDEAIVKVKDPSSSIIEAKRKAIDFIGLEVYEEGDGLLRVRVLADLGKMGIQTIIKLIGHNIAKLIDLILNIISGEVKGDIKDRIQIIKGDFVRHQHATIRYLMAKPSSGPEGIENYQTALVTSYFGFVNDVLLDIAERLIEGQINITGSEKLKILLENLKSMIYEVSANIASPSAKRLGPLCAQISFYEEILREAVSSGEDSGEIFLVSRLMDVARVLNITSCVLLCRVLMSRAQWVEQRE